MLWGDSDLVLPLSVGERFAASIARPAAAGDRGRDHFLQEDRGPLIGRLIVDWLLQG